MNRGGFIAGDLMGRTAFGVFAVILDACAVMMWIDQCRGMFGTDASGGPPTIRA
jgi:hypothetical protein